MIVAQRKGSVVVAVLLAFCWSSWSTARAAAHGAIDEQIATLASRIKEDPQNAALYLKRGELHSYHLDWDAAIADYDRAAQLDPTLAGVDLARGKTLLQAGSPSQAKSALDRFLAKHPEHAGALATRARVLVILGQRLAAAADYTRAIAAAERLDRPNPEYYLERARVLAAEGRSEEHTSELQSQSNLVCRLLLEKKKKNQRKVDWNTASSCSIYIEVSMLRIACIRVRE